MGVKGGSPMQKRRSLSKIIGIKDWLDVCDMWRIRNPKLKHFTFRQQHYSGYMQGRLEYNFVLKNLQELVKTMEILNAFSSDHSPFFFLFLTNIKTLKKSRGFGNLTTHLLKMKKTY